MAKCDITERFCPLCYEGRRGRRFHKGHYGYRKWQKGWVGEMAQYLQEPSANGTLRTLATATELCALAVERPATWEHLSETAWPSGKPRVTSTLLVFVEDGLVKLCLRDRATGRVGWVSGRTLTDALNSLETSLASDSLEWRRERPFRK